MLLIQKKEKVLYQICSDINLSSVKTFYMVITNYNTCKLTLTTNKKRTIGDLQTTYLAY